MSDAGDERSLAAVKTALRLVCISLPHLAGLAHSVRVALDERAGTAGIFASGRLVINPAWFDALDRSSATFVIAHELMHLALQTHQRAHGSDPALFNEAHDYIINDMLAEALGRPIPAGGLEMPGARAHSAESIAADLRRWRSPREPSQSWWPVEPPAPESPLSTALRAAGLASETTVTQAGSDVLPDTLERAWFPDADPAAEARTRRQVQAAAAKAVSLSQIEAAVERLSRGAGGASAGDETVMTEALRSLYRPPWDLALQQWLEAVAPGPRSYARPSRRGADRTDLVLAGRRREGWTLHIVLDTSGSMSAEFPRVLGAIASFCEGVNVGLMRILQCDVAVTRDELVTPEALKRYEVSGLGGSDMTPAMLRLAQDPEVEAAIVLTDGGIDHPREPMPYAVLWVLSESNDSFEPPYGQAIVLA